MSRFIYALGIRHVGEHIAGILAKTCRRLEKIRTATPEELEAIHEIGPVVAKSIADFFGQHENQKIVDKMMLPVFCGRDINPVNIRNKFY